MKVKYSSPDGRMEVEVEGDQKQVFRDISSFQEIFENLKCGKCGSTNIRLVVRNVTKGNKTYEYFEARCLDCGAKLEFGQSQDENTLFPKKKTEEGEWKPDGGWTKWNPMTNKEE